MRLHFFTRWRGFFFFTWRWTKQERYMSNETRMSAVRDVTNLLFKRYQKIIENLDLTGTGETSKTHLLWMCNTAIESNNYPLDKLSRWLGFIQGVLVCRGHLSVNDERTFSRPLFHQAYKADRQNIPLTLERK